MKSHSLPSRRDVLKAGAFAVAVPFASRVSWAAGSPMQKLQYAAVAVAKLVDDQVLDLDQTLAHHLPSIATRIEHADQITLAMLVRHRSGIPNYSDDPSYPWFAESADEVDKLALIVDDTDIDASQ